MLYFWAEGDISWAVAWAVAIAPDIDMEKWTAHRLCQSAQICGAWRYILPGNNRQNVVVVCFGLTAFWTLLTRNNHFCRMCQHFKHETICPQKILQQTTVTTIQFSPNTIFSIWQFYDFMLHQIIISTWVQTFIVLVIDKELKTLQERKQSKHYRIAIVVEFLWALSLVGEKILQFWNFG